MDTFNESWPALPYSQFKSTGYLLHMLVQAIGKLKLTTPFEPRWANVVLDITSQGITTGIIPYKNGVFTVDVNLIHHQVICTSSWGGVMQFDIKSSSVAEIVAQLFDTLKRMQIEISINPLPQEISNPIAFHEDKTIREYNPEMANAWWRILLSSYCVLQKYHARFIGITPKVGLMWGTFDLRDARYTMQHVPAEGINAGYIRRNAMDVAQVEAGWWGGNELYPRAAYYSFIYPQPKDVENMKIQPSAAHWDKALGEFVLDYDDLRKSSDPEKDLFNFFESTYHVEAEKAGWDERLETEGEPV